MPAVVLTDADKAIAPHVVDDPTRSLLYKPLTELPDAFGPDDRERLAADGQGGDRRAASCPATASCSSS